MKEVKYLHSFSFKIGLCFKKTPNNNNLKFKFIHRHSKEHFSVNQIMYKLLMC